MKTTKNDMILSRRNMIVFVILVFIALTTVVLALKGAGITNLFLPDNNKTIEQKQENDTNTIDKQNFIEKTTNQGSNGNNPIEHTSEDITLTSSQEADGSVTIMAQLANYSDGTCNLSIINGNDTYSQTAEIIYQPTFSTCAGFNVPSGKIPAGVWQITLTATSKGATNSKTITAEVK